MAAFQELPIETHNIDIDMGLAQLCKGQDQTYSGIFIDEETGEQGKWAMITDGHGSNTCISFLRYIDQIQLNKMIGTKTPVENMAKYINQHAKIGKYESSGATMCLVKIYKDRIVSINCGDSQISVYKNNEHVFLSKPHDTFNLDEIKRIYRSFPGVRITKTKNIKIVSEKKMIGIDGEYIDFPSGTRLMMSQSLGHNGNTGYAPDHNTIYYNPGDKMKIIIGSDGFWDMILKDSEIQKISSMDCKDLLDFAVKRWLQDWDMYNNDNTDEYTTCRFVSDQCDDVGVVTVDIIPNNEK